MPLFRRTPKDALTGLQDRESFTAQAQKYVGGGSVEGLSIAFFRLLNLGAFGVRFGIDAGDDAVKTVASCLVDAVSYQCVGRFSSGNFMALVPTADVEAIVDDINRSLPSSGEQNALLLKAGYCELHEGITVPDALARARFAFDDIRYNSPARSRLFDRGLEMAFERRKYVVEHLGDAIARGEIRAFSQPIVRVLTGMICEVEVLARWESEQYGFLRPDEFIPELEKAQLIHHLDAEVIRLACKQWHEASLAGINVPFGINLSRLDFELTDIFAVVTDAMRTYDVPVGQMHIEITESALTHDNAMLSEGIERFRNAGFTLYLDDFGSGYSSLRVLEGTGFDVVKLDMSLLREVESNERARVIVADSISMVKRLSLQTLCEGVETEDQFMFLKAVGCEKAQGYYFGKPMRHEEIMSHLTETASLHENPEDMRYYDSVGHINLMDGTRSNVQGIEAAHFLATQPFALVEILGESVSFLTANSAFLRFIQGSQGQSLQDLVERLSGDLSDIRKRALYTASKARATGLTQQFDFVIEGSFCTLGVTHVESSNGREAFLIEVVSVTKYSQFNNFRLLESSVRFLYTIFKRIDLLDVIDDTWHNIYLNVPRYHALRAGGTPAEEVDAFCETFIHPDDRTRFREFYDFDTLEERLSKVATVHLADTFFAISDTDRYEHQVFMIIPVVIDGHRQYLSCMRDVDRSDQARSRISGYGRVSDEVLLTGLLQATDRFVFWKDDKRRFLGANQGFLDFFGFSGVEELRGKTDEELGWGVENTTFREDELCVLSGESLKSTLGYARRKDGELRDIVIYRRPLYFEGKVSGFAGIVEDMGRHKTHESKVKAVRQASQTNI